MPRAKDMTEQASQPKYPDLTKNLNSFTTYNTDSGYHGMPDDDDLVLPDVQQESQTSTQPSTQPFTQQEPMNLDIHEGEIFVGQQTNEESFHSAQENVRSRGVTVEPNNDPTPNQVRTARPAEPVPKESQPEIASTPTQTPQPKLKDEILEQRHNKKEPEPTEADQPVSKPEPSPAKASVAPEARPDETQESCPEDEDIEDANPEIAGEDTVLDTLDDIGSPSDGSTPERPFARKSSLSFATLPAREPLKARTSYVDLAKMSTAGRPSYFGRQTGGHRVTQAAAEESAPSKALGIDNEKEASEEVDSEQATRIHSKKSTQSLHERISMLGKLQPSRPRKSIPSASALTAGQVPYPELPAPKPDTKSEASSEKAVEVPPPELRSVDDDWIKPLSSPQKPELHKSKTTDVMEKLAELERERATNKKDTFKAEPERPKSSASIFSSPRHGHQQSAPLSHFAADASTTPTGSPRRFDGHISASKLRLHSIMKSAKGLFSSTGNTPRAEHSSPEPSRIQPGAEISAKTAKHLSQPVPISSPQRQEGRRTRSSTEKEERRRHEEQEEREREEQEMEELRVKRAREQEKQKALQVKAARETSSVEPEERASSAAPKASQSQRQESREPEHAQEYNSRFAIPQPKQSDRRPMKPTREPLKRPTPQPMSIRVGSTMSRQQIPIPSSSGPQDLSIPVAASAPTSRPTLKKKGSNTSLHTSSSASSFKSSVSSQTQAQRKAQVASDRKKEQEREVRRKEEQKRELERKRAAQQQQQEEARRQEMRNRAEAERERQAEKERQAERERQIERERRERSAQEDPSKAARMEAIKKRQAENARKHGRQGSQQIVNEVSTFISI